MGDIVHAMVALQFIKQAHPDAHIDWVVEKGFVEVLEGNPHIDRILPLELKSIKKKWRNLLSQYQLAKAYGAFGYDIVIDAQGLVKSALVARAIGAKRIVGFGEDSIREGVASVLYKEHVHIPYDANTIDRNVAVLCRPLGLHVKEKEILAKEPFLFFIPCALPLPPVFYVFVVGSTWESRNYPKEKFLQIAQGLQVKTLVAWGNEDEYAKALWLQERCALIEVLPKGSLNQLKYVIAKASLVIGNDTGPTHMAWGFNVPSITLFGPTPLNRIYLTPLNQAFKSSSHVNHFKLNKQDFSIGEIDPNAVIRLALQLTNP